MLKDGKLTTVADIEMKTCNLFFYLSGTAIDVQVVQIGCPYRVSSKRVCSKLLSLEKKGLHIFDLAFN